MFIKSLFNKFFTNLYFSEVSDGLGSTTKSKIIENCNPGIVYESSSNVKEAVYILHGALTSPLQLSGIFDFIIQKEKYDVYRGLLNKHCQSYATLKTITLESTLQALKADVNFLGSKGYTKIYLIGHSLGGAAIIKLSIDNLTPELNDILKIICICPYISSRLIKTGDLILPSADYLKTGFNPELIKHYMSLPMELPNQSILRVLYDISKNIEQDVIIRNRKLNSSFYFLLCKNDYHIPFNQAIKIFPESTVIMDRGMHEPFILDETKKIFFQHLDDLLNAL